MNISTDIYCLGVFPFNLNCEIQVKRGKKKEVVGQTYFFFK